MTIPNTTSLNPGLYRDFPYGYVGPSPLIFVLGDAFLVDQKFRQRAVTGRKLKGMVLKVKMVPWLQRWVFPLAWAMFRKKAWVFPSTRKHFPLWVFPKIGVPQNRWFIMENLIKIHDLGVPLFLETPISAGNLFFLFRVELC